MRWPKQNVPLVPSDYSTPVLLMNESVVLRSSGLWLKLPLSRVTGISGPAPVPSFPTGAGSLRESSGSTDAAQLWMPHEVLSTPPLCGPVAGATTPANEWALAAITVVLQSCFFTSAQHVCSPSDEHPPAGENRLSVRLHRVWQPPEKSYYKAYQR